MNARLVGKWLIMKKIGDKNRKIKNNYKYIFVNPLRPTLTEIRRNVISDSYSGGISHNVTGKLLRSVGTTTTVYPGGAARLSIRFGYHVKYGLDLELGSKRVDSIRVLEKWIIKKFGKTKNSFARARALQERHRTTGTQSYPIIQTVWKKNKEVYFKTVNTRFKRTWGLT
tara:strand:- start:34149 stop:34658 length:510 start_codon:yes stop_codon:yes gene_type:complete